MSPCPPGMSRSLTWSGSRPRWGHDGTPTEEQIVYLDLSEPDSVVLYGEEETASGVRARSRG